jgi:glucokinase
VSVLLGVDVGGTATKWALVRDTAVLGAGELATPRSGPPAVVALLADLVAEHGPDGVGVAVPGHLNRHTGVIRFVPNLRGDWTDFPLAARLSDETGRPVTVLNDSRAFATAELATGAALGLCDVLFLTLGTGVGGAYASGGRVLVGPDDRLGEIGHVVHDPAGTRCGCGTHGCLETFASSGAISRAYLARTGITVADARAVVAAAESGDADAALVLAGGGDAIGAVLASVLGLLPAQAVVVGGGVAGALPWMREAIHDRLARRRSFVGEVEVRPAALGTHAGAVGAAFEAVAVHGKDHT